MEFKQKLFIVVGGSPVLITLLFLLPQIWPVVIVIFAPLILSFLWQIMRVRQRQPLRRQPLTEPSLENSSFASYKQGYQVQMPITSRQRDTAQPKEDPPGTIYEEPQAQYPGFPPPSAFCVI